jgi:hypothetical protein
MLREDTRAAFAAGFLRRRLVSGELVFPAISHGAHRTLVRTQAERPVRVGAHGRATWWMFRDRFYRDDDALSADEVMAVLLERERRRRRQIDRALDLMATEGGPRREPVPETVRREVFRRDGGRCTACGGAELLQFDHVIPVALGGASTAENLQLLCADCNRAKGASL